MAPSQLLIVDVQKGFINQWTGHIPAAAEALQHDFARVRVTRFVNPPGSPHRALMGWQRFPPGSPETELAFAPRSGAAVAEKATYTCITPDFLTQLRQAGITRVHLCGIATDTCVLKSAVDLFEAGIEPVVLAHACASHGGPNCHQAGLMLLRRFIGAAQVIDEAGHSP